MRREERKIVTLETRRHELIVATLASIRRHGYINSTIATISEESGLSRGLISRYFQSKDDLLLFAFRYLMDLLDEYHRTVVRAWGTSHFDKLLASAMVPFIRVDLYPDVWLHFWSASRFQPEYAAMHRSLWGRYRASIQRRITVVAAERGLTLDIPGTALMFTQLIDGLWLGLTLEETYDHNECRRLLRNWLCEVFRENPAGHSTDPPFDVEALQAQFSI